MDAEGAKKQKDKDRLTRQRTDVLADLCIVEDAHDFEQSDDKSSPLRKDRQNDKLKRVYLGVTNVSKIEYTSQSSYDKKSENKIMYLEDDEKEFSELELDRESSVHKGRNDNVNVSVDMSQSVKESFDFGMEDTPSCYDALNQRYDEHSVIVAPKLQEVDAVRSYIKQMTSKLSTSPTIVLPDIVSGYPKLERGISKEEDRVIKQINRRNSSKKNFNKQHTEDNKGSRERSNERGRRTSRDSNNVNEQNSHSSRSRSRGKKADIPLPKKK